MADPPTGGSGRLVPRALRLCAAGLFGGAGVLVAFFAASATGPHGPLVALPLALLALAFGGIAAGLGARIELARQVALVMAAGVGAAMVAVALVVMDRVDAAIVGMLLAAGLVGWSLTRPAVRQQFSEEDASP